MTSIIAYGTVVRSPALIGLPLPGEELSVGLSIVVEEDFCDDSGGAQTRGLYRVVLVGAPAISALESLRIGSPVLIRGELFPYGAPLGDGGWNHRLVFGDELIPLAGELPGGRAYAITTEQQSARVLISA
jgi:hypothetical protein